MGNSAANNWLERADYLLSNPTPENWGKLTRIGTALLKKNDPAQTQVFFGMMKKRLEYWPQELSRRVPKEWPEIPGVEYIVNETSTYNKYILDICSSPRLLLRDKTQAVRLARRFTGVMQSIATGRTVSVGEVGAADLAGSLTIEVPPSYARVGVALEVEIKSTAGTQSEEQILRQRALQRRGEIYICTKLVSQAVDQIVQVRDNLVLALMRNSG